MSSNGRSIVIYLPDLSGGGAERLHLRLLPYFIKMGYRVTFLLDRLSGELLEPARAAGATLVALGADRQLKAVPKLTAFLSRERPDVLISNMEHMNVMAVLARRLARVRTRLIVTQHNAFSEQIKRRSWQFRILPTLYRLAIPRADHIVAVSAGVADDLAKTTGLPRQRMTVIYNGVVTEDFEQRQRQDPGHPWFTEEQPIILAMGRMVAQKDFGTLIKAFAIVARSSDARLLILGDGPQRDELEALVRTLGIGERVDMPGFKENALGFLSRSRLFVLSSRFEGFGNVVAEALACGTPVVSTDCPHGPAEILAGGQYGTLVPIAEPDAMAEAILECLGQEPDQAKLRSRGELFSMIECAKCYGGIFE